MKKGEALCCAREFLERALKGKDYVVKEGDLCQREYSRKIG